jgi:hypothetical protein
MELEHLGNYIWTRQLDLDLEEQRTTAMSIWRGTIMSGYLESVKARELHPQRHITANLSTRLYERYNYLTVPYAGISSLYHAIKETFHECLQREYGTEPHSEWHMQCWMNCYQTGEFIDWHDHWPRETESWHGFYCVDVEPDSSTHYRLGEKYGSLEIEVKSRNNQLVISKSDDNFHKSSEWRRENPRITIAFDIAPSFHVRQFGGSLRDYTMVNHWIPI